MRPAAAFLGLLFFPLTAFAGSPELPLLGPPEPPKAAAGQPPIPCTRYDLHGAVQFARTDCLQLAIRHMDVNDRDMYGDTPLHSAIHFRNAAAIRFLIRNGADLHLPDFQGRNAIQLAESLNYRRLQEFLLAVERETERLQEAVENGDAVAASDSLLRGASLGMRDIRLDTVLHRAAESGLTEVGRLLVKHGANLEARNYLGETPLVTAALRDNKEFMKMLIEAGANVNAIDERRRTVRDIAELHADPQIVAMLDKKHARNGAAASVEHDFDGVIGDKPQ